jgi:hypothetical protein
MFFSFVIPNGSRWIFASITGKKFKKSLIFTPFNAFGHGHHESPYSK